jgi:hypothetical protein
LDRHISIFFYTARSLGVSLGGVATYASLLVGDGDSARPDVAPLALALSCLDVRPLIKLFFGVARVVGAVMSSAFFCGE